jgi:hypothetical protein
MRCPPLVALLVFLSLAGCSRFGAVYPPRPSLSPAPPVADPPPSRLVVHISVTSDGLRAALDDAIPKTGDGDFALGGTRHYTWTRQPLTVRFAQGRLILGVHIDASVSLPLRNVELPFDLEIAAEPVVNRDYAMKLQSIDVKVSSNDRRLAVANAVGGVFDKFEKQVAGQLEAFAKDLRPMVSEAYTRVMHPIEFPVGDAKGCARVRVLGVEAGPTVIADGLEKDLAIVVAPSVTLPCGDSEPDPPLPTLANVSNIPSGPFTVMVPVAASYDELTRAMTATFTNGKLFFSADFPGLYLEKPELYESQGLLVLALHLQGPVHAAGIDADLDGEIYFSGHVSVVDNQITIPDLEPTIETKSFLLSLKAMTGESKIREQARAALRLDLSDRLHQVRSTLADDLTFGGKDAYFHGDIDKIDVTGAFPHGSYLRVYVTAIGRASATMPCTSPAR